MQARISTGLICSSTQESILNEMLFNSFAFLLFLTVVFVIYWFVVSRSLRLQNLFLLLASYTFYAFADWRFLMLLIATSAINFFLGIAIERSTKYRKLWLYTGIIQGIGMLLFFKYYNFFISSFNDLFLLFSVRLDVRLLNIVVPIGISFFTFRTLSYVKDIYKRKITATTDLVNFFVYVSFFPCLLAGPIDKAKTFIPQLETPRIFDYHLAADGLRQILWGSFKKIVIADNCSMVTANIFANYETLPASSLALGAILYTIQIYADFSGYSDIAIGVAKLLGFRVTRNFDFPLFSQNIAQFWRKWHISLTSWLTEYVFTPLNIALRDHGKTGMALAILINFSLVGMWHGANWTYLAFGFLHGCAFIPLIIRGTMNKKLSIPKTSKLPSPGEFGNIVLTLSFVVLAFIIFRSDTLADSYSYFVRLFSTSIISKPRITNANALYIAAFFTVVMIAVEWLNREKEHGLQIAGLFNSGIRQIIYVCLLLIIIFAGADEANQFIYFKF